MVPCPRFPPPPEMLTRCFLTADGVGWGASGLRTQLSDPLFLSTLEMIPSTVLLLLCLWQLLFFLQGLAGA